MKKRNLPVKLYLKKRSIASLDLKMIKGGTDPTNDPTATESLGKQSTCPIETCTCLVGAPVRV
ncbi:hypothetical protein [Kordia jejudonensis]|uniref:hypothetical protein n=1 Tax=Kordia jejudonensis TaxID=1348245 RepID=UPI000629A6FC|nr:hypothetical protein [Kordia jejudonensis]